MTTRIDRIDIGDGEERRQFFLLAQVTFRAETDPADEYYADSELPDLIADWVDAGLNDRDDSPAVTFYDVPASIHADAVAVAAGRYPGNGEALDELHRQVDMVNHHRLSDPRRTVFRERTLMRAALEMIRDGVGDPAALARVALSTTKED